MIRRTAGRAWRKLNRLLSIRWLAWRVAHSRIALEKYGEGHAAWYVPADIEPGAVAYCGGVGLDASFDFALAERKGLQVFSFDPTLGSIAYMDEHNDGRVKFYPWGLLDADCTVRFYGPANPEHANWFTQDLHGSSRHFDAQCFTLRTVMTKLGHDRIDLLKIDIEGSWNRVLARMLDDGIAPPTLCVEFDSPAPLWRVRPIVLRLESAGYRLVHHEKENCVFLLDQDVGASAGKSASRRSANSE